MIPFQLFHPSPSLSFPTLGSKDSRDQHERAPAFKSAPLHQDVRKLRAFESETC